MGARSSGGKKTGGNSETQVQTGQEVPEKNRQRQEVNANSKKKNPRPHRKNRVSHSLPT